METVKKGRTKGTFKGEQERTERINLRLTKLELKYIDDLCKHRKESGASQYSRTDIIILSVRFASGDLTILERMEMNLADGNSLFDAANFNPTPYTKWLKTNKG